MEYTPKSKMLFCHPERKTKPKAKKALIVGNAHPVWLSIPGPECPDSSSTQPLQRTSHTDTRRPGCPQRLRADWGLGEARVGPALQELTVPRWRCVTTTTGAQGRVGGSHGHLSHAAGAQLAGEAAGPAPGPGHRPDAGSLRQALGARPALPARPVGPRSPGRPAGLRDRPGRRLPPRAFPGFCSGAALSRGPLGPGGLRARRATEHAKAGRPEPRARRGTCGGAGSAGPACSPPPGRRTRTAPLSRKAWKSRPVRSGPQQERSPRPGHPGPRCPGRSAPSSACPSRTRAVRRSPARPPVALAESSALPGAGPAATAHQPRRAPPRYLPTWRPSAHAPRGFRGPGGAGPGGGGGGGGRDALGALGLGSAQPRPVAGPPSGARVEAGPAPPPGASEIGPQTLRTYQAQLCFC